MSSVDNTPQRTARRVLILVVMGLSTLLVVLVGVLVALLSNDETPAHAPTAGIRPVHVILGPGTGGEPFFDHPMGAAFGTEGRIYVADTGNNRIVVFDSSARYLFQFGGLGIGKPAPGGQFSWRPGRLNYPTDVAVDNNGDVYVADFRNDQIQVFDAAGKFLRVFPDRTKRVGRGASGQDGTGIAVTSLAVEDGRVYATDRYQVIVFDSSGALLAQFGRPGAGPGDLDHPNGIAVGPNGMLTVSDSNHNRVLGLTPAGNSLWVVGERFGDVTEEQGGEFEVPRGLTHTDRGTIIVADALAARIVQLSDTGEVLGRFGRRGDEPGEFNFPTDVDSKGDRLVVAEKGNDRVQVVALEEK